ncbi:MAG TPA: hypothetical protein VFV38_15980 [Ktedonobacteraceae bacterium]|nr:hypothetical protein [Ktedonobacteraceae bacterium]
MHRKVILLLIALACMLALFLAVTPLQASAKSFAQSSAQNSNSVKVAACGDEWDAENYNSWLDVQLWLDTCTGKLFSKAYLLQGSGIDVFLDVGGLGGGGYASNERSLSSGQFLTAGEIYTGPNGAYACAAANGSNSVCTSV